MLKSLSRSTFIYAIICVVILSTHYLYYPKWKKSSTEATLSWDVSGYYMYLPAIFIYKDIKQCGFFHDVRQKYRFTPDFQQAYRDHKSGNYVMKYSIGQALHYSPFFLIAHIWASNSEHYEADGFSLPYQFMISLGSLLISFLGLFYVLKYLRYYFDDCIIGFVLVLLVLGSTYLNYSAIDGAMTHNTLFTIYAILIYSTIQFYKSPSYFISGLIGLLVGLAALTRPTELLSCLIPFIFGINIFNKAHVSDRISFLFIHRYKLLLALFVCLFIGSFQLIYWNYVTDQWFIYSYQEQGFSWRHPHLWDGFFSYKSGWLIYTPIMIFSIIGFWYLYKQNPQLLSVCLIFFILFVYIAFSWDIWWYGGSLGQRTMVQAYPILLFPLASFVKVMTTFKKVNLYILMVLMLGFIYLNLWYTHQAHLGGLLHAGQMTKAYFWKTLGRYEHHTDNLMLLDTDELYSGKRINVEYLNVASSKAIVLDGQKQYSEKIFSQIPQESKDWIRVSADFTIKEKEWEVWRMTQMIVVLKNGDQDIKRRYIRVQRHLYDHQTKQLSMDISIPDEPVNSIEIFFWNAESQKEILVDNVAIELYDEG